MVGIHSKSSCLNMNNLYKSRLSMNPIIYTLAKQAYLNPVITKFKNWRTVKIHTTITTTNSQQATGIDNEQKMLGDKMYRRKIIYQSEVHTQNQEQILVETMKLSVHMVQYHVLSMQALNMVQRDLQMQRTFQMQQRIAIFQLL